MTDLKKLVIENIRHMSKFRHMTFKEVESAAGVSQGYLSRDIMPSLAALVSLARALDVTLDDIVKENLSEKYPFPVHVGQTWKWKRGQKTLKVAYLYGIQACVLLDPDTEDSCLTLTTIPAITKDWNLEE